MNPQTLGRPSLGRLGSRSALRQSPWRVEAWRIAQAAQKTGPSLACRYIKYNIYIYMHVINEVLSIVLCVLWFLTWNQNFWFLIWNRIFWFGTKFSFFSRSDFGTRSVWSDHHMCLPWNLNVRFHMEKSLVKCSHLFFWFGNRFFLIWNLIKTENSSKSGSSYHHIWLIWNFICTA
jgi:hypothetical protein